MKPHLLLSASVVLTACLAGCTDHRIYDTNTPPTAEISAKDEILRLGVRTRLTGSARDREDGESGLSVYWTVDGERVVWGVR